MLFFFFPVSSFAGILLTNSINRNLQNANHVIFFAPFAAKNHYEYQSTITQSSGRAIRFGQDKEVHIWNMVTLNTLEVGVLQEQDGRILVRRKNGEYKLVLEYEVKGEDKKGFEVPSFDWKYPPCSFLFELLISHPFVLL